MTAYGPMSLRAGEVARAAGVNVQTLRYYERRGLLPDPGRTLGGHRLYPSDTVTVLRVIKAAQRLGFTLDEVAELLEVGRHHHRGADRGVAALATEKLAEVDARIADLQVIRERLAAAIEVGCDDLLVCAETEGCPLPFAGLVTEVASTASPG